MKFQPEPMLGTNSEMESLEGPLARACPVRQSRKDYTGIISSKLDMEYDRLSHILKSARRQESNQSFSQSSTHCDFHRRSDLLSCSARLVGLVVPDFRLDYTRVTSLYCVDLVSTREKLQDVTREGMYGSSSKVL